LEQRSNYSFLADLQGRLNEIRCESQLIKEIQEREAKLVDENSSLRNQIDEVSQSLPNVESMRMQLA